MILILNLTVINIDNKFLLRHPILIFHSDSSLKLTHWNLRSRNINIEILWVYTLKIYFSVVPHIYWMLISNSVRPWFPTYFLNFIILRNKIFIFHHMISYLSYPNIVLNMKLNIYLCPNHSNRLFRIPLSQIFWFTWNIQGLTKFCLIMDL